MRSTASATLCLVALPLALAACGRQQQQATAPSHPTLSPFAGIQSATPANAPKLADGPDVCFRAIAKQLGANAKVSEITSFFSAGSAIDDMAHAPEGTMTTCTVNYQNPADPRKLLGTSLDTDGTFEQPRPVEITVMGGDEAKFRLDDYLIPLSQVNAAALAATMKAQAAKLNGYYGKWAWSGVRLEAPDAFNRHHTLRLDVDGRLKSNDIKKNGYASVTTDGRTVTTNFLTS